MQKTLQSFSEVRERREIALDKDFLQSNHSLPHSQLAKAISHKLRRFESQGQKWSRNRHRFCYPRHNWHSLTRFLLSAEKAAQTTRGNQSNELDRHAVLGQECAKKSPRCTLLSDCILPATNRVCLRDSLPAREATAVDDRPSCLDNGHNCALSLRKPHIDYSRLENCRDRK